MQIEHWIGKKWGMHDVEMCFEILPYVCPSRTLKLQKCQILSFRWDMREHVLTEFKCITPDWKLVQVCVILIENSGRSVWYWPHCFWHPLHPLTYIKWWTLLLAPSVCRQQLLTCTLCSYGSGDSEAHKSCRRTDKHTNNFEVCKIHYYPLHTTERECEFGLAYGSEGRVSGVLCETFEWALEPGSRARWKCVVSNQPGSDPEA